MIQSNDLYLMLMHTRSFHWAVISVIFCHVFFSVENFNNQDDPDFAALLGNEGHYSVFSEQLEMKGTK